MNTYTKWINVPKTYKTKTQWSTAGYKLKPNAKPVANYYSNYHHDYYELYGNRSVTQKRAKYIMPPIVPETIDLDTILEALYIINKNVKNIQNKDGDYRLKDKVINKLVAENKHIKIEKHYAGPYLHEDRHYIIRSHYNDDDEYEQYMAMAYLDEHERPYISTGDTKVYDLFNCYYFPNNYSFHVPISFRTSNIDLNEYLPLIEDTQFISKRKKVSNVKISRQILKEFVN
jgi:hypothetical protein